MAAPTRLLALATLGWPPHGRALDNGLAQTPQMGYNSWYDVECSPALNETTLRRVADAMVSKGLSALGYRYLNLDDCWATGRDRRGRLAADPAAFPSGGLRELADYVHGKGLLFGTYTDRGTRTCEGRPASLGHEELDANTFAVWGVDYLKEDSCFASTSHSEAFQQYARMRDALNATGRPVFFSLCGWSDWYAPVGARLGNSWRVGPDGMDWPDVLRNVDIMAGLGRYAGPGGWNDPCMLLSKTWEGKNRVTELQTRAQFSLWAILAAPLLISGSVLQMSEETLATYSNRDVIAVSQDALGRPGERIAGGPLSGGGANVWARALADGSYALLFVNAAARAADVTCDEGCFARLGVAPGDVLAARDLWAPWRRVPDVRGARLTGRGLEAHGGHWVLIVEVRRGKAGRVRSALVDEIIV